MTEPTSAPDTPDTTPDPRDVQTRADLLDEERAAGSDDPEAQAAAILEESEKRTLDPEGTQAASSQTFDHTRETR